VARLALLFAALGAACSGGGAAVIEARDAGPSEASAPTLPDAQGDAPEDPLPTFRQFWGDRATLRQGRESACWKTLPAFTAPSAALEDGLAAGRVRLDLEAARACLDSWRARPCDEVLRGFGEEDAGCPSLYIGQVGDGEGCRLGLECAGGEVCAMTVGSCRARCQPPVADGACASDDVCPSGLSCLFQGGGSTRARFACAAPPGEGQPCRETCASGLFCSREGYDGFEDTDEGFCRARVAGGGCQNDWQCPLPLVCLRDAGGGHCGPPRAGIGDACTPAAGDCVDGTSCQALARGFSCQRWPEVGGTCGYLQVGAGTSETVGCASGVCDLSGGVRRGLCVLERSRPTTAGASGGACDLWNRCGPNLLCKDGRCQPAACDDPGLALDLAGGQEPTRAGWQQLLVHPAASRQPTPLGRRLATLEPWQGHLYVGYGDYEANTGPIPLNFFDPAANQITEELSFDTEAIALYRPLGDKLHVPAIDPRGTLSVAYAVGPPWSVVTGFAATHVFDLGALGSELVAVGSEGSDAVAWRSSDGGAHFTESLRQSSAGGALILRYYFAAVLGGKIYVQAAPSESGRSRAFDGTSWSLGPNLLPGGGQGWNPRPFRDQIVYLSWQPIGPDGGTLMAFDGTSARALLPGQVFDFAVDGDLVYALGSDGRVRRSDDLAHWWTLGPAPMGARSIAALRNQVFLGGTEGRLFMLKDAP
jgi:hypothetical protein